MQELAGRKVKEIESLRTLHHSLCFTGGSATAARIKRRADMDALLVLAEVLLVVLGLTGDGGDAK